MTVHEVTGDIDWVEFLRKQKSPKEESVEKEITESIEFSTSKIDREKSIIHGVSILGAASKNKRQYTPAALTEARTFFESAPVYLEHKGKKEVRDFAGEVRNLREEESRVKGDLHVAKSAEWLFDLAERFPRQIGLSITAIGKVRESAAGDIVEGFSGSRRSVDIVAEPATTKGLFEEIQEPEKEKKPMMDEEKDKKIAELEAQIASLKEEISKLMGEKEKSEKVAEEVQRKERLTKIVRDKRKRVSEETLAKLVTLEESVAVSLIEDMPTATIISQSDSSISKQKNLKEEILKALN